MGLAARFRAGMRRFVAETGDMLKHKAAQGAAELGQALNSQSNAYVPYGYGQQVPQVKKSFQEAIREAPQRGGRGHEPGMDR